MKYILLLLLIPYLAFAQKDKLAQSQLIQLIDIIKNKNINLDSFETIIREKYCTKMFFEADSGLECRLAKSLLKNLHAKQINVTTEQLSEKSKNSISLILLGYGEQKETAKKRLSEDYEKLMEILKTNFNLVDTSLWEECESPETLETNFSYGMNVKIQTMKLSGGCLRQANVIISICKESVSNE